MMRLTTIRGRLTLVVVLSLLPVILLGSLFGLQVNKDIQFAEREVVGTHYLQALAADLAPALTGSALPDPARFKDVSAQDDSLLGTTDLAQVYRDARRDPASDGYWQAALALFSKAGDGSNLILDPDLDSFYLMDLGLAKLPAAFASAARLKALASGQTSGLATDPKHLATVIAESGVFRSALAGTEASYASAQSSATAEAIRTALGGLVETVRRTGDALVSAAEGLIAVRDAAAGRDAEAVLASAVDGFGRAAAEMHAATLATLDTLLAQRIARLTGWLWSMLGISAGLVALVIIGSILLARSIVKNVVRFGLDVRAMADDRHITALQQMSARDEIGEIARAVQYLRERTIADLEEAEVERAREAERNARIEADARADREAALLAEARQAEAQRDMIEQLSRALTQLSAGRLDCLIAEPFEGEMEDVRLAFNRSVSGLGDIIRAVRVGAESIRVATSELLAGANDLSQRTGRQAGSIEQTTAAVRTLATAVRDSASLANEAAENGVFVSRSAEETGQAMSETRLAMERIEGSSQRIANIVGLIDEIAFQTNLLALNASVEAARAGEAGKGFAVVAVEVRRLAQSAAEASGEVKELIEEARRHVSSGVGLVGTVTERLGRMLDSAERNSALLREAAKRSTEQARNIEVIRAAIEEMEESIQQNAALVEESNAAIAKTEEQSNDLDLMVARFTVSDLEAQDAA